MKSIDSGVFVLLRNQARARARQRPQLWREYKRRRGARPGGRFTLPLWLARLFWALMLVSILTAIVGRVGTSSLLAMLALYCSGTIFLRAARLRSRLYRSTELLVALHYPLEDREFFRWQVRDWLISCLFVLLVSAGSYACVAVYGGSATALVTRSVLGAFAQTAIVITLSLSRELWLPRIGTQPALVLYALIVCVFWFPNELGSLGGKALAFLPATWVNLWFASSHRGAQDVIPMLVSIGSLGALDAWLVRSLAKGYPRTDLTRMLQHALDAEATEPELTSPSTTEDPVTFGRDYAVAQERFASLHNRTALVEQLTESDFDWTTGHWTTRLAGRWLTRRQRVVAEFLSANAIDAWSGREKRAVQLAAVGVFLCLIPIAVPLWLSLSVFIMAALTGAPLTGGTWPALKPGWFGFVRLPPLAGYPIGYLEASLSMMKVNAVRLLGFAPTALGAGLLMGWRYFDQPMTGLLVSGEIVLTSLAIQPYCSVFLHSAGTNDTQQINRTSLLFACALIANAVLLIPAAIAFFVFNRSIASWIMGPLVLVLLSWAMWRFYGFLYSRQQIDLIPAGA